MTFDRLRERFPAATAESWHRHANGGGWVENTASVDAESFIGEDAIVGGLASIAKSGVIWGGVIRGGVIRGGVIRGGVIRGGVIWGGVIWGGDWKKAPLFIQGTRHPCNISAPGMLAIGCLSHPVDWWRENRRAVGKREGYTPQDIEEYGLYIELAARWFEIHPGAGEAGPQTEVAP